jgi:hypothetical protein
MSMVKTQPKMLAAATHDLAAGASQSIRHAAVASPPTVVAPAAADVVSALTAVQFGTYAAMFQAASAQFAAAHEMFVESLAINAGSHAATEPGEATAAT